MSQLVKAIAAHDTGNRKALEGKFSPLFQDVFEKKEHITEVRDSYYDVAKLYRISVTLGQACMISELDQLHGENVVTMAIERTKKSIIEAVFGEFREDFMQLNNALYDRDFAKARTLLNQFEDKMFSME
jgi:hypothetical protein